VSFIIFLLSDYKLNAKAFSPVQTAEDAEICGFADIGNFYYLCGLIMTQQRRQVPPPAA